MKNITIVTCLIAGGLLAGSGSAEARVRHHTAAVVVGDHPLTVTKRSWLDMGNVVPVGTENSYLSASTVLNRPTYATYIPGKFWPVDSA